MAPTTARNLALLTLLTLAACGHEESGPWVAFDGGGFVINYSGGYAAAFYGFNVKPLRQLPAGTVLEASFEDPGGGPPIVVRQTVAGPELRYSFRTPFVHGLKADYPYKGEIRVLEANSGRLLASYSTGFKSKYDEAWLNK